MTLRLYNSLHRQIEPFHPLDPQCPTMYVCGPTVYDYVHIGNARGPVIFGILSALLRRRFGNLRYARNITDVDDKICAAALSRNVTIDCITEQFSTAYREDMQQLGVEPPDIEPRVTLHIPHIIAMIDRLIRQGHVYAAEGHVLFSVNTFKDYGKLSRRSLDQMRAGARVDVAPYKHDPSDFVLWKPSSPEQPGWPSPWGRGRPGWHIECSAMAATHLGKTIDIHAGGVDLQFPHHENEIAQSECCHAGAPYARYWLHNGMLNLSGAKMSKSLGNIATVRSLLQRYPAEALRHALLSAHYRQPLEWSSTLIDQSLRTLNRMYGTLHAAAQIAPLESRLDSVEDALDDDLNTPNALAALAQQANALRAALPSAQSGGVISPDAMTPLRELKGKLLAGGQALGLLQQHPDVWFRGRAQHDATHIEALIQQRTQAKNDRDFARADALRAELSSLGIIVEDTVDGVRWRHAQ